MATPMDHAQWMDSQRAGPERGAMTDAQRKAREKAIKDERKRIVASAAVEAGEREGGEARKAKKRASRSSRDDAPRPNPKLEVLLVGARDLPKMDMLLGKCDGYVRITVGEQEEKSKTVIRSYNPVFGQRFVFEVRCVHPEVQLSARTRAFFLFSRFRRQERSLGRSETYVDGGHGMVVPVGPKRGRED